MKDNRNIIKKLQLAINQKFGEQLLYERRQFYSQSQNRPVNMYMIKKSVFNKKKQKMTAIELFKSPSQIQIILFLRDYWFELNGWEVPIDNPEWNIIKCKAGLGNSVLKKESNNDGTEEEVYED